MMSLKPQLVFEENDGSELGSIIFDVETVLLTLDDSVAPAHTNIVDSHLTLMTSSQFEFTLLRSHC